MDTKSVSTAKHITHVEILFWSPKGIPLTVGDTEMILERIKHIRHDPPDKEPEYDVNVQIVAFDLVDTGDEDQDHAENFLNLAKVCSYAETPKNDKEDTLHVLCLRERFPVQALSALHDLYVCSGSPIDLVLKGPERAKAPKDLKVGVNGVFAPVVEADGSIVRWTSIF